MPKAYRIPFACLLLIAAVLPPTSALAAQEPPGRDPAFEQEVYDRLSSINPDAVPLFKEATREMDAGNLEAARQGYEQVLSLAPGFPDALRRLSYVEGSLHDIPSALAYAEQAYSTDPCPHNRLALARALLAGEDRKKVQEGYNHALAAAEELPEDPEAQLVLLQAGLAAEETDTIREASTRLIELAPAHPLAHYFAGLVAAVDGQWEEAERELLLAQELGMPAEDVQKVLDQGIRRQARLRRWLRRGGYVFASWLISPLFLFLTGTVLSKLTLRAARHVRPEREFRLQWQERLVRALYRGVIALASLYFYISVPLLIVIVVIGAAAILYVFSSSGVVSLRLLAIVGIPALYTLYAIVRGVFARVKEAEPGRPLTRDEAPALWSLTEEVASRLETRAVDAIYVTPSAQISVTEQGRLLQKLRGAGRRVLRLGLGVLAGMTQSQFRTILAHEYGHFSNRDTAGGNLARRVHISIVHMAYGLAATGQARWYNPAWLFVQAFNRLFLRITLGASRLQEILADRYAAMAYGARVFIRALRHIIHQSLVFNATAAHEIATAREQERELHNLYRLPPLQDEEKVEQLEAEEDEVMKRPTSPYDSHPAPRDRIELLESLRLAYLTGDVSESAWELLPHADALQAEMTAWVQERM